MFTKVMLMCLYSVLFMFILFYYLSLSHKDVICLVLVLFTLMYVLS